MLAVPVSLGMGSENCISYKMSSKRNVGLFPSVMLCITSAEYSVQHVKSKTSVCCRQPKTNQPPRDNRGGCDSIVSARLILANRQ